MFGIVNSKKLAEIIKEALGPVATTLGHDTGVLRQFVERLQSKHDSLNTKVNVLSNKIDKTHSLLQSHVDIKTNALEARIAKLEAQLAPVEGNPSQYANNQTT